MNRAAAAAPSSCRQTRDAINQKRLAITALRQEIRALQSAVAPEAVEDYAFHTSAGTRRLSQLFGAKDDLIIVHNMGAACAYRTLWADGFNGVHAHLLDRAAFVVTSPDAPEAQATLAAERGWRFPITSTQGSDFAADMGDASVEHGPLPGVSAFQRRDRVVLGVADAPFGPGDDFAGVWRLFDLFPEGAKGWSPKRRYGA